MNRTPLRTRRLTAVLAVASLVVVLSSPQANADGDENARHNGGHVTVTVSPPTLVGGDFGCDPTDATRCVGTFRNVRTVTGDLEGTAYQVGAASALPDGTYQGAGVVLFTGTVRHCGAGTLVIVEAGVLDPLNGGGSGTWDITAGQGTGELAGAHGNLRLKSSDNFGGGVITGRIRCR